MNLSTLKKNGFSGADASLDISLTEYGLIWKQFNRSTKNVKKGEFQFWFGVGVSDDCNTQFDWCYLNPDEFISDFDWCDFKDVANCNGLPIDDWLSEPFENRICDLVGYYGTEDIFGSSYYPQPIGGLS